MAHGPECGSHDSDRQIDAGSLKQPSEFKERRHITAISRTVIEAMCCLYASLVSADTLMSLNIPSSFCVNW